MPSTAPMPIDPAEGDAVEFYLLTEAAEAAEQLSADPYADDVEDRFAEIAWFGELLATIRRGEWPTGDQAAGELLERALLEDAGHIATEQWVHADDRRLDMGRYKALRCLHERATPGASHARA